MSNLNTRCLTQKTKKWFKKPKVDVTNPNKYDEHTRYMNQPWDFNTKNRDRPSGHTTSKWNKAWTSGTKKHDRHQNQFFITKGLQDLEDDLHAEWESYFEEEDEWYDWGLKDSKMYDDINFIYDNKFPGEEEDPYEMYYDNYNAYLDYDYAY